MEAKGKSHLRHSPLITAGVVLGLGFGGLFDGILLLYFILPLTPHL